MISHGFSRIEADVGQELNLPEIAGRANISTRVNE
jgi:hypothetical protein